MYEVKLRSALTDYLTNFEAEICEVPPKFPAYYFFYRTLTAPKALQKIIDLSEEPKLRKAKVIGYALAKWGDYPMLMDGEGNEEIFGYAYIVKNEEEAQKLAYYETNAYEETPCLTFFVDDEEPVEARGRTFMYAGDANALLEQRFDRKLWPHQMNGKSLV